MKKVLLMTLAALTLCGSMAFARGQPAGGSGDITIAGIVFQEDQFMKLLSLGYADAAKAAGVRILQGNTANDQAKEAELINTYLSQGVKGIAIAPLNPETSVPVLQKASEQGMLIAVTNQNLKNAPFIVGGYTSDDYNLGQTSGEAAGKFIAAKLGGNANMAIVDYAPQLPDSAAARVNGFLDGVKKHAPNAKLIQHQAAWMQDTAVQVVGDILTANPNINIVYGANDGGTIGSVMAVKNAGLSGKCFVFGIDTGDQQLAMLRDSDNILQAVTGQDPYKMGVDAVNVLVSAIKGGDYSATKGKTTIVPGVLVSRDNPAGIDAFEKDLASKIGR
jgi:simple sugar transport system substrate-binding protein/ribose transport system substrate-binding protein